MNLLQLARRAQFEVDALRTGDVASGLWSDEQVYSAINTAVDSAYRILRLSDSDIVTTTMKSTDATIDLVEENYLPSSLAMVSGTADYTLPPDFVSVKSIIPITSGYDEVQFVPLRTSQRLYRDQRAILNADLDPVQNTSAIFYYVIIGRRTLRIVPTPQDAFDIELLYHYRPVKLKVYSTGTVTILGGTPTIVTGTGSLWVDVGLRTPAEFVSGSITAAVNLGLHYPTVSTIDSNTQVTLRKSQSALAGSAYRLAMAPVLPEQYHDWLAQMAAAILLRRVNIETSTAAAAALEKQLVGEVRPEIEQRQSQDSIPVEPYELA